MTPVETLRLRAELKTALRDFFGQRDSLEIDTPIAVIQPGTEVHLRYFPTVWLDHRGTEHPLYLRSSPELHMKQALALGLPRTLWSLENAFTTTLGKVRTTNPMRYCALSLSLQSLLAGVAGLDPVDAPLALPA